MTNITEKIIQRLEALTRKGDDVLKTKVTHGYTDYVDSSTYAGFATQAEAFFISVLGPMHPYTLRVANNHLQYSANPTSVRSIQSVLESLRFDIENDYIKDLRELVHADLFTDFIEMAQHLLEQNYKDAAAVITGSVLEAHMRKLADKKGISTTLADKDGKEVAKKASILNDDLAKASVYGLTQKKQITSWLDMRNNAAHGQYAKYTSADIRLLIQSVDLFRTQFPA